MFKFTPAVSFVGSCDSQEDIDHYWHGLSEGGAPNQCGWLEDPFGLSWQVVPTEMPERVVRSPERVIETLLAMGKIDLERLREVAAQSGA